MCGRRRENIFYFYSLLKAQGIILNNFCLIVSWWHKFTYMTLGSEGHLTSKSSVCATSYPTPLYPWPPISPFYFPVQFSFYFLTVYTDMISCIYIKSRIHKWDRNIWYLFFWDWHNLFDRIISNCICFLTHDIASFSFMFQPTVCSVASSYFDMYDFLVIIGCLTTELLVGRTWALQGPSLKAYKEGGGGEDF